jgi:mRNA interferase RelE/StbE
MGSYKIVIKKSAWDELSRIPKKDGARIVERIRSLAADPRPPMCQKLSAGRGLRIRQGDYRIVYFVDDGNGIIDIKKIGHRREIYRKIGS